MRHLTRELRAIGSKAGATAAAATLAVGGVAVAQTGEATPEPPAAESEGGVVDDGDDGADAEDGAEGGDAAEGDDDTPERSPGDGDAGDDDAEDDAAMEDDGGEVDDDGGEVEDDDGGDDGGDDGEADGASNAVVDVPDDPDADRPAGARGREGRGSATSERVHEALTLDGELRPGDEGWGAAVSESARAGGHGQRVSRAARGEDTPAPAARTTAGEDAGPPAGAPGRSGQAPGRTRGGR